MAFTPFVETDQPTMAAFNEKFQELLDSDIRISVGTYVGTGKKGVNNKNSLTFDFTPAIVFISNDNGRSLLAPMIRGCSYLSSSSMTSVAASFNVSWDSNSVFWYYAGTNGEIYQMNESGVTYYYVAFGFINTE